MKRLKAGDRVRHSYLGDGEFLYYIPPYYRISRHYAMVKWDNTPPIRYNMGRNPCMVFRDELEVVRE